MRRAAAWTLALCVAAAACSSKQRSPRDYVPSTSKYDALDADARAALADARAAVDRGELERAREIVDRLAARQPDLIALALWRQDLEFAATPREQLAELALEARRLAEDEPTVVNLLLAARLDADAARATVSLDSALELDRECAWAHYALAYVAARSGRWADARTSLERALALEPGHLSARRLEAAMLARNGQRAEAIAALRAWLAVTRADALIDAPTRVLAQLDLAQLELLEGNQDEAHEILLGLAAEPNEAVRRLCLLAAIEQARGNPERALTAAREAEARDTEAALPLLQQAMLQEHELDDPAAARRAWQRVLELSSTDKDLGALILGLRARVALERAAPVGEGT